MKFSPVLIVHICGGTVGLLAGFAAVIFRKGSRLHRLAGVVFVVSMLTMSAAAVYLAITRNQMMNVFGGSLTFYLVTTAWLTARRRQGETSALDWVGLVIALAVGMVILSYGLRVLNSAVRPKDGVPAGMYFFMGSIALLSAAGDLRMLVWGGVSGTRRLVRHLWRMCFALFVASGSIFIARPHLFPAMLRTTYILPLLGVLPLIMLIFWAARVRFGSGYKRKFFVPGGVSPSHYEPRPSAYSTAKTGGT